MNTLLESSARSRVPAKGIAKALTALLFALPLAALAQDNPKDRHETIEVFHLAHITQQNDLNDLLQAVRNSVGSQARVYADSAQSAIVIRGTAEELDQADKVIAELDRPLPLYKITFIITQLDGDKITGSQHYMFLAAEGQKVEFKDGHKVPVITGKSASDDISLQAQMTYVDVGVDISASFQGSNLRAKIEESAVADEKSTVNIQDPIIRQVWLTNEATIIPGKTVVLGSFDIPNSTKHREVEVLVERAQ